MVTVEDNIWIGCTAGKIFVYNFKVTLPLLYLSNEYFIVILTLSPFPLCIAHVFLFKLGLQKTSNIERSKQEHHKGNVAIHSDNSTKRQIESDKYSSHRRRGRKFDYLENKEKSKTKN